MNYKKIVLIIVMAITLISFGFTTSVLAGGNTGDTSWGNEYRYWSPDDHTPARRKENKSAYYNKTTFASVGYIWIWAALYDGRDVSDGHDYRSFAGGKSTKLYNLAVEKHGRGIAVRIDSRRFANGSAKGVWSPDSKK